MSFYAVLENVDGMSLPSTKQDLEGMTATCVFRWLTGMGHKKEILQTI